MQIEPNRFASRRRLRIRDVLTIGSEAASDSASLINFRQPTNITRGVSHSLLSEMRRRIAYIATKLGAGTRSQDGLRFADSRKERARPRA
jgi:hypothetical protein